MTAPVMPGPSASSGGPGPHLTHREMEVLTRVANGATYVDLAREWTVAEITVRTTGAKVLRKLGASSIAHAVFLACQVGILDGRARRHGDHAGFAAHVYRDEEPCEACWDGERAYRAERRAARKAAQKRTS